MYVPCKIAIVSCSVSFSSAMTSPWLNNTPCVSLYYHYTCVYNIHVHYDDIYVSYSWKYWRSLNLVVLPQTIFFALLADLNLAVWYGFAVCTFMRKKFWQILI